jgi:spore coat protein H
MKLNIVLASMLVFFFVSCNTITPPIDVPNKHDSIPNDTIRRDTIPGDSIPVDTIRTDSITEEGTGYIYDINSIPCITLEISTAEWNKLLSYFDQNPDNQEYIHSNFRLLKDGKHLSLKDIGLRIRGNTSRRRPEGSKGQAHSSTKPTWHHASFALSFKKFVSGQEMAGAEKLNLKWFKDDATYAREVYCYDLFERFGVWTAPQSSYCRLKIKINEDTDTIYYGVYQMVEPVDKDFIKNRLIKFTDKEGNLWKSNWGADFKSSDKTQMGIENITLTQTYIPVYDLKTNESQLDAAKTQLADFITNLNSKTGADFKTWISEKMDVELFLKTYAVSVICGMWDDYWCNKNNFYFYFDSSGKFYFIPFDYDNTLGTSSIIKDSGRQDPLNWGNTNYPLVTKIIAIPEYKALYIGYLKELCNSNNDYFYVDKSMARIINWQNKVRPFVNNDTKEDTQILDTPASWGNCSFYRLLDQNNNYFKIRAANTPN